MKFLKQGNKNRQHTYQICIDGIPITVCKKRIQHMYLRIKKEDGTVYISAPCTLSDARIRAFAAERIDWIQKYRQKYTAASKQRLENRSLSRAEIEHQKRLLKQKTEQLVRKWEPVLQVEVSGITIRQMKTRWGSCNVETHHININLALLKKPPECLEYVVVHEMTHLLEPSHNQIFWGYMTQFYPNWRRVRQYLNDEPVE